MDWIIPTPKSRKLPDGYQITNQQRRGHLRDGLDFCVNCGTDLLITRLHVSIPSELDVWRLHISEVVGSPTIAVSQRL